MMSQSFPVKNSALSDYQAFLARKGTAAKPRGMDSIPELNPAMRDDQRDVTEFLLKCGAGAAFLDTGMGKSLIELEWLRVVRETTNRPVLMLAPLAVSHQHAREAAKFGIDEVRVVRSADEVRPGINITNYERLHLFQPEQFAGLALDESSIIKSFSGKTTRRLMSFADGFRWLLAGTATPAPNDHMEIGQHSQFLDVMDSSEMLARWFIADQSEMGRYRLKGYAVESFWSWVASWSRCASRPSDLGYSDEGFDLPPLEVIRHSVDTDLREGAADGELWRVPDTSATAIHREKRLTAKNRAEAVADIVAAEPGERWVIWCDTDYEADALMRCIPEAVEVRGSMSADEKERKLVDFSEGRIRVLVSKPRICGFGMNWQDCARTAFVGLSFSYEQFYQAVRRFWRFGQQRPVHAHVVMASTEESIMRAVDRKAKDHAAMKAGMVSAMRRAVESRGVKLGYEPKRAARLPEWLNG